MAGTYITIQGNTIYTLNPTDLVTNNNNVVRLICKTGGGAITIKLPLISAFPNINTTILVDDTDDFAGTNNITIESAIGNTIENAPNYVINSNGGKVEVLVSSLTEFSVFNAGASSGGAEGYTYAGLFDFGQFQGGVITGGGTISTINAIPMLANEIITDMILKVPTRFLPTGDVNYISFRDGNGDGLVDVSSALTFQGLNSTWNQRVLNSYDITNPYNFKLKLDCSGGGNLIADLTQGQLAVWYKKTTLTT